MCSRTPSPWRPAHVFWGVQRLGLAVENSVATRGLYFMHLAGVVLILALVVVVVVLFSETWEADFFLWFVLMLATILTRCSGWQLCCALLNACCGDCPAGSWGWPCGCVLFCVLERPRCCRTTHSIHTGVANLLRLLSACCLLCVLVACGGRPCCFANSMHVGVVFRPCWLRVAVLDICCLAAVHHPHCLLRGR